MAHIFWHVVFSKLMPFIASFKCIVTGECYPYNFHFSVFGPISSVILWNPRKFPSQLTYPFLHPHKILLILSLKIHHILCIFSIFHNSNFLFYWHIFLVVQLYRCSLLLSEMELVFFLSFSLLSGVIAKRKEGQKLLYSFNWQAWACCSAEDLGRSSVPHSCLQASRQTGLVCQAWSDEISQCVFTLNSDKSD